MRAARPFTTPAVLLLVAGLAGATPSATAQEYEELSLEQLLDVVITSASKREESIYKAPSVMEVITAEDIQRMGANNLRDVLDRATSLQTIGSNFNPENVVTVRGQGLQHENNHVLMLINGRPLRESTAQGLVSSFLGGFPLDLVSSIEIIRGPGSVLYGSSAFSGVINVKTRPVEELKALAVSTSYGSYDSKRLDAYLAAGSADAGIVLGGRYMDSDGWDIPYSDWLGASDTFKTADNDASLVLTANYGKLSVNGFIGRARQQALQPTGLYPVRTLRHENGFADVGFEHGVGGEWTAKYDVTFNYFDMGDVEISSHDWLGEATISGPLGSDARLMVGGTFERHNGEFRENQLAPQVRLDTSKELYSVYAQADLDVVDWLKLIGGFQYNKPRDQDGGVSPRLGVVGSFQSGWGFKLLYGEAFRSATFVERNIIAPGVITGNPLLRPEEIATFEAQLFLRGRHHKAALTYYHSRMSDIIKRVGFPIEFENSGEITFDGVEMEGTVLVGDAFSLGGSVTYQRNEDQLGLADTTFTPHLMAKVRATWDVAPGFRVAAADSYFGDPSQVREFVPSVPEVNAGAARYHLVTLNATVDFNEMRRKQGGASWRLELFVDNLLDEDINYPDINALQVNSFPLRSGRGVYSRVVVGF